MRGSFLDKVAVTISDYGMVQAGDLVIVAVSGGPDSVCLLDCLNSLAGDLGVSLVVAHFDHGLRPAEDPGETAFVQSLAVDLGIPFETNTSRPIFEAKGSEEEQARTARYEFLEEVRVRRRAGRIAVGHTIDDQAETVVMRLLRGSGGGGLSAIPPVREGIVVRPLIRVSRAEVIAWLGSRQLDYVTDSSNLKGRCLRNRVRSELIPMLRGYQPKLPERLANTADILRLDNEYLESLAAAWVEENSQGDYPCPRIPISGWSLLHPALRPRVLRHMIGRAGSLRRISSGHLNDISRLAESDTPQGGIDLPGGLRAVKTYGELHVTRPTPRPEPFSHELNGPGKFRFPDIGWEIILEEAATAAPCPEQPRRADFDMDLLSFPLVLRPFRPGDRMVPSGMTGSRKIKDIFIDMKLPSGKRSTTPILLSSGRVVWVCGIREDDRFKVTDKTKRIASISMKPLKEECLKSAKTLDTLERSSI